MRILRRTDSAPEYPVQATFLPQEKVLVKVNSKALQPIIQPMDLEWTEELLKLHILIEPCRAPEPDCSVTNTAHLEFCQAVAPSRIFL